MAGQHILKIKLIDELNQEMDYELAIIIKYVDKASQIELPDSQVGEQLPPEDLKLVEPAGEMPADPVTKVVTYFAKKTKDGRSLAPPVRIKQPIAVVKYQDEATKFLREEPTIRNLRVD